MAKGAGGGGRYTVSRGGRGDYMAVDTRQGGMFGTGKVIASGSRADVSRAIGSRVQATRTRASNERQNREQGIRRDVAAGFYNGIPLSRMRGAERRIVAAARRS